MATPATSKSDTNSSSNDQAEKESPTSDTQNGRSGNDNMKVRDFMSFLAKEANISNMTVETKDGRRISATFKNGLPTSTSIPLNESTTSDLDPSKSSSSSEKDSKDPMKTNKAKNDKGNVSKIMSPTRDIATTIAMMGTEKIASTTSIACHSQEWAMNYNNKHVAVTYSSIENDTASNLNEISQKKNGNFVNGSGTTTSLPPKKRKTEEGSSESSTWNAMSALVDAATVAQREHEKVPPSGSAKVATVMEMNVNTQTASFKKKSAKRKPRKIIPEVKEYVEFTQKDVLFGRGGRSNHHPGNKIYRDIVTKKQNHYRGCDKNEKTKVAQGIVDHIQNEVGGRFLELDRDIKRWFLVPNVVARRKVGQALRENNTEEARAAKRAKYQGRLNSKKKVSATAENMSSGNGFVPMIAVANSNDAVPLVTANGASRNAGFPISTTELTTNTFPTEDTESSVAV